MLVKLILNCKKDTLNLSCHGGKLNESRFGVRMRGEGQIAKQIKDLMTLAKHKYFKGRTMPKLNTELHEQYKTGQLRLF